MNNKMSYYIYNIKRQKIVQKSLNTCGCAACGVIVSTSQRSKLGGYRSKIKTAKERGYYDKKENN